MKNCRFTDVVTSRDGSTAACVCRIGEEYYSFECGDGLILNFSYFPSVRRTSLRVCANSSLSVGMSNVMPGIVSEIYLHSNPVTSLRISVDQKYLFSAWY